MPAQTPRTRLAVIAAAAVVVLVTPSAVAGQQTVVQAPAPADTVVAATPRKSVPRLRGFGRFGAEGGGDAVMEFAYEDGSDVDMSAGGGLHLLAGVAVRALHGKAGGLDAQLGVGLKWRTIPEAENQDANWLRFPVEGMLVFRSARGFGIGAGATVHLANKLRASGDVLDGSVEFENTPGVVAQLEYAWRGAIFDLRYTGLRYRIAGVEDTRIDASSIGGGISFMFGRKGEVR